MKTTSVPPKIHVTIEGRDSFNGVMLRESTTHYLVAWEDNEKGEWFAKKSRFTNCEPATPLSLDHLIMDKE
jgi:hypothetical protein